MLPPPPGSTLFPYTTLFRSWTAASPRAATASASRTCGRVRQRRRRRLQRVKCAPGQRRSEEHTSELQSLAYLVCRLLLEKKKDLRLRRIVGALESCGDALTT